jgi:hypothetical protein
MASENKLSDKINNFINNEMDDRGNSWSTTNRNDFVKGTDRKLGMYNDPTYLGFILLFQPNSPLLSIIDTAGTAYHYLLKIGETARAEEIKILSSIISDINKMMPWYWQSVEGLDVSYKYGNLKDGYKSGDDAKITINTLESIDLKITQIIELYRHICFDMTYRREIVPENLRKFRLWVWVQELRKFQIKSTILGQYSPWFLFQLDHCEFQTDESNPYLAKLSFADPQMATNKLVIKYEDMKYSNGFNFEDLRAQLNSKNLSEDDLNTTISNKIESVATAAALNLESQLENAATNAVEGFVTSLFLGNAHGFSMSNAIDSIQQASVSNIIGNINN